MHELSTYLDYRQRSESLAYWQLTTGVEVDFIVGHMKCAVEAKSSRNINADHLKGLRELKEDFPVGRRIVVCMEDQSRVTADSIEILPYREFTSQLWSDRLL